MDNDVMDSLLKFEPAWKNELTRWKEMKDQVSQNTSASVKWVACCNDEINVLNFYF